jgi:uncharacterized protein (DUF924 family)
MLVDPESLLDFWFGEDLDDPRAVAECASVWFGSNDDFDDRIRERFAELPDAAGRGDLDAWRIHPRSTLALVLALDQLPRNLFRDTPQAFAYDAAALETARWAISRGMDAQLNPLEAVFLYLPLEHDENPTSQMECVSLCRAVAARAPSALVQPFESFVSFAERHRSVIERFGRFPHRNRILGRASTPEEIAYLNEGGETFSGSGDSR